MDKQQLINRTEDHFKTLTPNPHRAEFYAREAVEFLLPILSPEICEAPDEDPRQGRGSDYGSMPSLEELQNKASAVSANVVHAMDAKLHNDILGGLPVDALGEVVCTAECRPEHPCVNPDLNIRCNENWLEPEITAAFEESNITRSIRNGCLKEKL